MDEPCEFCTGLLDHTLDVVAESASTVVILDRMPINRGHMLVIPRRHASQLSQLTPDEFADMARHAHKVETVLRTTLGSEIEGTNLLMSNGSVADQSVFHAHLHVIPRQSGDGFTFTEDFSRYPRPAMTLEERALLTELLR